MRGRIDLHNGPLPIDTQPVLVLTAIMPPDTLCADADGLREETVWRKRVQRAQVPDENALELGGIGVARVILVAGFLDHARVGIGQFVDGCFGDASRVVEVLLRTGREVQFNQGTQHDTLVV